MERLLLTVGAILLAVATPVGAQSTAQQPIRLPSVEDQQDNAEDSDRSDSEPLVLPERFRLPEGIRPLTIESSAVSDDSSSGDSLFHIGDDNQVTDAFAHVSPNQAHAVAPIPSFVDHQHAPANRIVRYEIPLADKELHQLFHAHGIEGQLMEVVDESGRNSLTDRLGSFLRPTASRNKAKKIRVVRYEVPADDIAFHAGVPELEGQLLEPWMLRLPEVRFFQPKARVFMDLKQSNDGEFDLFNDGALLASLDIVELYFPMPLISERFAEAFGRSDRLASIGWRFGGTIGLGITTALNNGSEENGSAPVSTLATGLRYEFPLGRPSRELLVTGDHRLDQRTRVGIELGLQGGISTRESLRDSTDVGLYFGILVNTPWGG